MNLELWKNRLAWLAVATAILISGRLAHAQVDQREDAVTLADPADAAADRPWLGLQCFPADPTLRAQLKLPEGQGLVVGNVAPDSPAAKAGIENNDILLTANDRPLSDVPDLVKALEQAGGGPLKVALLRGGESKTAEVKPARRAADRGPLRDAEREIGRLLQRPGEIGTLIERLPERFRLFRAGQPLSTPFPADLSLSISKQGDEPARVVVKKGDDQWEVTEDKLGDLPEHVRGYVEMFLGRLPTALPPGLALPSPPPGGPPAPGAPRDVLIPREFEGRVREQVEEARRRAEEARQRIRAEAGPVAERVQDRVGQLERQLQERLEKLDRLIEERTRALEAKPETKPETLPEPKPEAESSGPALSPDAT